MSFNLIKIFQPLIDFIFTSGLKAAWSKLPFNRTEGEKMVDKVERSQDVIDGINRQTLLAGIEVKLGVDTSKLDLKVLEILPEVKRIWATEGKLATITSSYEKVIGRLVNSLHYQHLAFDLRVNDLKMAQRIKFVNELKDLFGKPEGKFDIVLKPDHLHIEYDPLKE